MANVYASHTPARIGAGARASARHTQVVRRRRVFLVVLAALVTLIAVLANYGPVESYYDARSRLDKAMGGVAGLRAEKAMLQAELGRLSEADYLESLARQDLSYTRPGEELYIVTGMGYGGTQGSSESAGTVAEQNGPGFLERILGPLEDGY